MFWRQAATVVSRSAPWQLATRGTKPNKRKFGRTWEHRLAMLRNMVTSLINHERIRTTTPKAKSLQPYAEKLIKFAKRGTIHDKNLAAAIVREQGALMKLFDVLGPRYAGRSGGYTRVLKLAENRKGDNAPMAYIEFIDRDGELRVPRPPRAAGSLGE